MPERSALIATAEKRSSTITDGWKRPWSAGADCSLLTWETQQSASRTNFLP